METNRNQYLEVVSKFLLFTETGFERYIMFQVKQETSACVIKDKEHVDFIGFSTVQVSQ